MKSSKRYLDKVLRQIRELQQTERPLLVVSDFHLSEGFYEIEGKWAINEDFFSDYPFARFLRFAEAQRVRQDGAPWRLICNGDIFDFRQVGVPRNGEAAPGVLETRAKEAARSSRQSAGLSESEELYGPGTTPLMSGLRVDLVYQGHATFFQALAWFVARGNELVFIKGNHDVELHWPKTQWSIRRLLARGYEEARAGVGQTLDLDWRGLPREFGLAEQGRIFFLPWNYYEPGRVYIEHGQQFHATDSEKHVLWPRLPWNENELELTLGELFGRYFITQLEALFPLVDNIKPFSKGINWVLVKGIPSLLVGRSLWSGLKKLWHQFRHALRGAVRIYQKSRRYRDSFPDFERQRRADLKTYGAGTALGEACALQLEALKSTPALRSGRLLWQFLFKPLLIGLGGLGLAAALWAILTFPLGLNGIVSALAILIGGVAWIAWRMRVDLLRPERYLMDKAAQIHRVLRQHDKPVRYVLMGHDHHAHLERLDTSPDYRDRPSEGPCYYLNSGTWTALIVHDAQLVEDAKKFAFIRVVGDTAHLMRWNDGGGTWEPMVLS
jgi:UDP-2,3-diacylglucosamine pyrophosphatase LpxH